MSTYRERLRAQRKGSMAAARATARMQRDPGESVNVFSAIEQQRIWLMFQPLDHLYGFYNREGDTAGIVLHNGHPLSLQRFTAAHELGHHVLAHQRSMDSAHELNSTAADVPLQEIEAQAFAADFLMPPELMNRAMGRLGLAERPTAIEPMDAYQLSLEIGSSYRATISQLRAMGFLTSPAADALRASRPIDIKAQLANGERPGSARSDVWLVTDGLLGRQLHLRLDDELHVRLPEIPSGGYRWHWHVDNGPGALELLQDAYEERSSLIERRVGARRQRHLWFRAAAPSRGVLRVRLLRSWQGDDAVAIDEVAIGLMVARPRTGDSAEGASRLQRRLPEAA